MLVTFTGRKSGRRFTIPVRYVTTGDTVRCFSSPPTQWWRNLRGGTHVNLRIAGKDGRYFAEVSDDDPEETKKWLQYYLEKFPQDAAYHDVRLNPDKSLVQEDLERASYESIVVRAEPAKD